MFSTIVFFIKLKYLMLHIYIENKKIKNNVIF